MQGQLKPSNLPVSFAYAQQSFSGSFNHCDKFTTEAVPLFSAANSWRNMIFTYPTFNKLNLHTISTLFGTFTTRVSSLVSVWEENVA